MTCRFSLCVLAIALVASLALDATAQFPAASYIKAPYSRQLVVPTPVLRRRACGADYSVPCRRGVAILSPIESPDNCDYPVGGKTTYTPYYVDYCPHRQHGPRVYVPGNGYGYLGRGAIGVPGVGAASDGTDVAGTSDYGFYQGARQDETNLLHLGGFSDEHAESTESDGAPDVIDIIDGSP